jgi:tetratricopeptide (TPR) repeat protein
VNTLRSCAAALLLAVPTGISATAVAQTDQISVDREACINSNDATAREAAAAACTRLLDALARGEITGPEGAAVHVARGNHYALRGEADLAIADYDRAIMLDPNRAVAFFNRAGALAASGQIDRALADYDRAIEHDPMAASITRRRTMPPLSPTMTWRSASSRVTLRHWRRAAMLMSAPAFFDRAAEDYSRLIDPGNAKAWNNPAVGTARCWAVLRRRLQTATKLCVSRPMTLARSTAAALPI